jgi:hypothetical protein
MGVVQRFRKQIRSSRVAYRLTLIFESAFEPFRGSGGQLDTEVGSDEFVIAYMYGVMAYLFDKYGTLGESARVLWKCYEHVFPGLGQEICELTVVRVKARDEKFLRDVRTGSREAKEYLASKGKSSLPSLTKHLEGL